MERMRPGEEHALPGGQIGRDRSGHGKYATEQGALKEHSHPGYRARREKIEHRRKQ
jgi:hypothetical protein